MKKQIREVLSKYRGNQGYTMEHAESELLNLFSVSKTVTAEQVVEELEDCDTLDDAIMFFKEQM